MRHNFPYLMDSGFLREFDRSKLKEQIVKIIVLNFNEDPIEQIQGKVVSGNFTIDGSSAMRRTGNLNLIAANRDQADLRNIKNLLSINKKIEVLIGFVNNTDDYLQYDILWFPQGVFVIMSPNITYNNSGINISLTLHDKMALLNGECGGTLPASVVFHEVEEIDDKGNTYIKNPTIYQIIQELVNHFGEEQLGKIIISDIPNQIKRVMKWTGSTPLYFSRTIEEDSGCPVTFYDTNYDNLKSQISQQSEIKQYSYGQDVGYILTDFTYPGELIGNAGDSVVSILDQIKNVLGNFEYFYDLEGNFRFQEIRNFLNKSYSTSLVNELNNGSADHYLVDYTDGKSIYTFEDADIIQSIALTPQYQQVKNDFLVWGKRTSIEGKEIPIRYHLAIDSKPMPGNEYQVLYFIDPDDGITKAKRPIIVDTLEERPRPGDAISYYYVKEDDTIYKWNFDVQEYEATSYTLKSVTSTDYRTQLYLQGSASDPYGRASYYYYTQFKNEWPKLYDIENQCFFEQVEKHPSDIDFFLDLIDSSAAISEFSVQNIGRRTVTIVDDKINCIFEPDNPDVVIIEKGIETGERITSVLRQECEKRRQEYSQVESTIYRMLANGGALRSAYEEIRKELYQYTSYNEQVSLTTLPVYYLQPNSRITIHNNQNEIFGEFMIKTISLPLNLEGTMTLTCTKVLERI